MPVVTTICTCCNANRFSSEIADVWVNSGRVKRSVVDLTKPTSNEITSDVNTLIKINTLILTSCLLNLKAFTRIPVDIMIL